MGILSSDNYIYVEDSFNIDILTINGINIKYITKSLSSNEIPFDLIAIIHSSGKVLSALFEFNFSEYYF